MAVDFLVDEDVVARHPAVGVAAAVQQAIDAVEPDDAAHGRSPVGAIVAEHLLGKGRAGTS